MMTSPKIHILGAGNIGALVGTALASTVPPAYVTYLLRTEGRFREYMRNGSTISLSSQHSGAKATIERKIPAAFPFNTLQNGNPEPIDNLIVTTKGHQVRDALTKVMPALHPTSNILLLHNGLGVYESVIKQLWPNPAERPHISMGITSHAVHRGPGDWNFNHVGTGFFKIAQVPKYDGLLKISHNEVTDAEENVRADYMKDVLDHSTQPSYKHTTDPTSSEASVKADYADFPAPPKKGVQPDVTNTAIPTASEEAAKSDYTPGSPSRVSQSHDNEIFDSLTNCDILGAEVIPYPELLLAQYEKLIVNSVINPLTAILGVKNGALAELDGIHKIVHGVVNEGVSVLRKHAESVYSPDTWFVVNSALEPRRMTQTVWDVCESTSKNISSMLSDINTRQETEIEFINEYIVKLAQKQNKPAFHNQMLANMVRAKLQIEKTKDDKYVPLL